MRLLKWPALLALIITTSPSVMGQQADLKPAANLSARAGSITAESGNGTKPQANAAGECKVCRWFELQTATLSTRYRLMKNSQGEITTSQLQYGVSIKPRFKFDRQGNYSVNAGLFTGNTITLGWNNTGVGTGKSLTNLYLKQLYFSAKPVRAIEVQYGGLYVERGESTEITSYDNDAYITGERLSIKQPRRLFFDQITVTYAYLGDLATPSIFRRWSRLNRSNYHQFLVSKMIGKRANVSADYTFQSGIDTVRAAARINTKELHVLDSARIEIYRRLSVNPDGGFAVSGERSWLNKRVTIGGGYAQIDRAYGRLNGDRYYNGKRLFVSGGYQFHSELGLNVFWTRAIANPYTVSVHNRFELILTYNFLKTLQRRKLF